MRALVVSAAAAALLLAAAPARAQEERVGYVNTAITNLGLTRSHRVEVVRFDDPRIEGVSCWLSHAATGGIRGTLGVAEDPSRFALDCRATGPIRFRSEPRRGERGEAVFERDTSLLFKETTVTRFWDEERRAVVYLAWSTRLIDGSPYNAVSVVPLGDARP